MKLEEITKKVLKFTDIPEDMEIPAFVSEAGPNSFVECHIDDVDNEDDLSQWLIQHFPELQEEDSFLIHVNY